MDYLDYMQMTKSQQIGYKIKSFFFGIPGAIKTIVLYIGYFFKSVWSEIYSGRYAYKAFLYYYGCGKYGS